MKNSIPALPLALLLGACGPSIESAQFRPAPEPTRAGDVLIFTTRRPACEYEELGMVTGQAKDRWDSLQEIIDAMRARAARMGGDAMVQLGPGNMTAAGSNPAGSSAASLFVATVVRFTAPCNERE